MEIGYRIKKEGEDCHINIHPITVTPIFLCMHLNRNKNYFPPLLTFVWKEVTSFHSCQGELGSEYDLLSSLSGKEEHFLCWYQGKAFSSASLDSCVAFQFIIYYDINSLNIGDVWHLFNLTIPIRFDLCCLFY